MDDDALLAAAKAYRDEAEERRLRQIGEFETTLPTPNVDECDRAALGEIVLIKQWDLAPIDPQSFDPFEPPGRPEAPVAPPEPTAAPVITALTDLVVGSQLVSTTGSWTGSPTYARQWRRGATNIGGGTGTGHVLVAADVGQMITCNVTATNAGGSVTATSNALGPITATGSDPEDDGETVHPTGRRKR
jgi:hypothetical protein